MSVAARGQRGHERAQHGVGQVQGLVKNDPVTRKTAAGALGARAHVQLSPVGGQNLLNVLARV
ncbi:hypothetical protein ABEP70_12635, partial [Cutibacterium acnes]